MNIRNVSSRTGTRIPRIATTSRRSRSASTQKRSRARLPTRLALRDDRPLFGFVSPWVRLRGARGPKSAPVQGEHQPLDPLTTKANHNRADPSQGYAGDPDHAGKDQSGSPCRPCARPSETSTDTFSNVHQRRLQPSGERRFATSPRRLNCARSGRLAGPLPLHASFHFGTKCCSLKRVEMSILTKSCSKTATYRGRRPCEIAAVCPRQAKHSEFDRNLASRLNAATRRPVGREPNDPEEQPR